MALEANQGSKPDMRAVAKINLYLAIVGKRPNGYHDLCTVFLPLPGLADDIIVEPHSAPGIVIECDAPELPVDASNLCWQAAEQFCQCFGVTPQVRSTIRKRIPIAAGLGGGSSNAAAVLLEMRRLFAPTVSDRELAALAVKLGADVPFFLRPVPSLATGIGEVLTPITVKATPPLLLASPGFPVSAAWAYGHWRDSPKPAPPAIEDLLAALAKGDVNAIAQLTHNDLEYCVLAKFPLLRILRQRMLDLGCLTVHVSGSGPTLFGIGPGHGLEPDALSTLTEGVPMLKTWFFPGTAATP
jgi:4-diphosphocytidyl-2-C-methyl-D-erythritol kinase